MAANTPFGWSADSFMAMWWWATICNPVNNMRFVGIWQAPVAGSRITYRGDYKVEDSSGQAGLQFVITENSGKRWYGLYWVHQWSEARAFVVRLGFKVKPSQAKPRWLGRLVNNVARIPIPAGRFRGPLRLLEQFRRSE